MHFQTRISDWLRAVVALPDNVLVKSVSDPGLLREAVQAWTVAGRRRESLTTVFRHYGLHSPPSGSTWEQAKTHWRGQFSQFVNRTYLEQYAGFVNLVQGENEHTASSTWTDPFATAQALLSERAAASVWNTEFRGRHVVSQDGGEGDIPSDCKLTLLSGPVGNDFPLEIFQLSVSEDCPIDYHAYTRWQDGQRYAYDWQDDSGLWAVLEARYGLRPEWIFGECGPYLGVNEGWRHPAVLNGDQALLKTAMRAWYMDVTATSAFREGRILGQGAWFTSGIGTGWECYQYHTPDLIAVCDAIRDIWKGEKPMVILAWADINAGDTVRAAIPTGCLVYQTDRRTLWASTDGHPRVATWTMNVQEVTLDGWLRVSADLWVRSLDVRKSA